MDTDEPGIVESGNYRRFLDERQKLLANSANEMLATLRSGVVPPAASQPSNVQNLQVSDDIAIAAIDPNDEEAILVEANRFATEKRVACG